MKWAMLLCVLIGSVSRAWAAEQIEPGAICPEVLGTSQKAISIPDQFQATDQDLPCRLQDITFSDGPPSDKGTMVPSETAGEKAGVAIIKTWRFRVSEKRPVYVSCHYDNTTVTLMRSLDSKVHKCVVTYNPEIDVGGYPKIVSSSCR